MKYTIEADDGICTESLEFPNGDKFVKRSERTSYGSCNIDNDFSEQMERAGYADEKCKDIVIKDGHSLEYEFYNGMSISYMHAIEIVKQEAEKCKSIYMNGEYCWQSCWCTDRCGECNRLCNGDIDYYESYDARNNGWIQCSERLPEDKQTCLVTARIYFTPDHVDEIDNYIGVGIDTYSKQFGWLDTEPIAWQPLPAPYQPKGE